VLLSDVQLELPRLDLAAPPRLLPDSRVAENSLREGQQRAGVASEGAPSTIRYTSIRPAERPARILSNLARAPIPVSIDLMSSAKGRSQVSVAVRSFPVKFFNREATLITSGWN